jgi:hypothetical protein
VRVTRCSAGGPPHSIVVITHASSEFRYCFNREPVEGDLLRWEHVRAMCGPEINEIKFGDQIEAWQRQLPQLPRPLKLEEGRLFKRQRNGDWLEALDVSWMARWWGVECDARGMHGLLPATERELQVINVKMN